jgi:hypothetical protein
MQLFLRIFLLCLLFFALLGGCARVHAQSPTAAANSGGKQTSVMVEKPVRKTDQVVTDDSIALLAVRRGPAATAEPVAPLATEKKTESSVAGNDGERKTEEIAALQQQIKDKQKRIAFLLRLFVDDEKAFLVDPSNANTDPVATERRQYEQDELRWETAELGKL